MIGGKIRNERKQKDFMPVGSLITENQSKDTVSRSHVSRRFGGEQTENIRRRIRVKGEKEMTVHKEGNDSQKVWHMVTVKGKRRWRTGQSFLEAADGREEEEEDDDDDGGWGGGYSGNE